MEEPSSYSTLSTDVSDVETLKSADSDTGEHNQSHIPEKSSCYSDHYSTCSSNIAMTGWSLTVLRLLIQQLSKSKENNANHFKVLGSMNTSAYFMCDK